MNSFRLHTKIFSATVSLLIRAAYPAQEGKPVVALDLHYPWLHGPNKEWISLVGEKNPRNEAFLAGFIKIIPTL